MLKKLVITSSVCCWLVVASVFLLSNEIQAHILLNRDISWFIHVADYLLTDPTYAKNFDVPPAVLYLYMLPVIISKILSVNIILAWRISVFSMILISLLLCYRLLNDLFLKDAIKRYLFFISLSIVLLILPIHEFGQREHLMMILLFPYFCLATLRVKSSNVNFFLAFLVGLLAGIGVSLKPYFLISVALVELYLMFHKKEILAWLRVELITILSINVIYIIIMFVNYQQIFDVFFPLMLKLYYGKNGYLNFPLSKLAGIDIFLFCCFSIFFFAICMYFTSQKNKYVEFGIIIFLGLVGFIASYLIQRAPYYYRIYPAFTQAILLFILIIFYQTDLLQLKKGTLFSQSQLIKIFILICSISVIFCCPIVTTYRLTNYYMKYKINLLQGGIAKLVNQYPPPVSSYFMTANSAMPYPLPYYTNMKISTRFFNFWWLSSIVKQDQMALSSQQHDKLEKEKNYLISIVAAELKNTKPLLVFVDTSIFSFDRIKFDFIAYFNQNSDFKKSWEDYKFFKNVENFKVYKRKLD